MATKEGTNPIKQDMKKGKLRDYPLDIFWNYGTTPSPTPNTPGDPRDLTLLQTLNPKTFADRKTVDPQPVLDPKKTIFVVLSLAIFWDYSLQIRILFKTLEPLETLKSSWRVLTLV